MLYETEFFPTECLVKPPLACNPEQRVKHQSNPGDLGTCEGWTCKPLSLGGLPPDVSHIALLPVEDVGEYDPGRQRCPGPTRSAPSRLCAFAPSRLRAFAPLCTCFDCVQKESAGAGYLRPIGRSVIRTVLPVIRTVLSVIRTILSFIWLSPARPLPPATPR